MTKLSNRIQYIGSKLKLNIITLDNRQRSCVCVIIKIRLMMKKKQLTYYIFKKIIQLVIIEITYLISVENVTLIFLKINMVDTKI